MNIEDMANPNTGAIRERADAIVEYLSGDRPPTATIELCKAFNISRGAFDRSLRILLNEKQRRIYVADWKRPNRADQGGSMLPMYKAGNLPDVPMPQKTPEERKAQRREWERRRMERLAAGEKRPDMRRRQPEVKPMLDPLSAALFGRATPTN